MNYKKQVDDLIDYAELNEIIKILKVSDQNIFFVGGATRSILSKEYTNTDIDIVVPNIEDSKKELISINEIRKKIRN